MGEERDAELIERCQGFVEYLRARGFSIGIDRALRIQRVLGRVGCDLEPLQLATVLAPLVATSPDEQRQFHEAFAAFYPFFREPPDTGGKLPIARPRQRPDSRRARRGVAATAAAVVLALGIWLVARQLAPAPRGKGTGPDTTTPSGPTTTSTGNLLAFTALPPESPADLPAPVASRSPWTEAMVVLSPAALGLVLFTVGWARGRRKPEPSAGSASEAAGPYTVPIHAPQDQPNGYAAAEFLLTARRVRQRQRADGLRLLVDQTVVATIEASRFPTLRYENATRPPEYLFLIARSSLRDHQARLFDDLARGLAAQGVFVSRYFFEDDPSVSYAAPDRFSERDGRVVEESHSQPAVLLSDLQRLHVGWRLLVCSDGSELVDSLRGDLTATARQLTEWSERAVLTPAPFEGWSMRERTLDAQFVVRPATLVGLRSAVDRFDATVPSDVRDLGRLAKRPKSELPPTDATHIGEVEEYLGEPTFRWACACALYPELHWDLTLALGKLPEVGPDAFTEENLLRTVRLPWFRQAWMPEDVRASLTAYLSRTAPKIEEAARRCIVQLVERNAAPEGSVARRRQDVVLVAQRVALAGGNDEKRREALEAARSVDRAELFEDSASLSVLKGARPSRLPGWLSSRIYHGGLRALGVAAGTRALLVFGTLGLLTLIAWLALPLVRRLRAPVSSTVAQLVPTIGRVELWPNDTVRLGVTAFDAANQVTVPGRLVWSIDKRTLGTVDTAGLVRAGNPSASDSGFVTVTASGRLARTKVVVDVPGGSAPGLVLVTGTPRVATLGDSIAVPPNAVVSAEARSDTTCVRPVLGQINGGRAPAVSPGRATLSIPIAFANGRSGRREESVTVRPAKSQVVPCTAVAPPVLYDTVLARRLPPPGTARTMTIRVGQSADLLGAYRNTPNLPPDFSTRLRRAATFRSSDTSIAAIGGFAQVQGRRVGRAIVTLEQARRSGYQWRVPISVIDTTVILTRLDSIFRGLIRPAIPAIALKDQLNLPRILGVPSAQIARARVTFTSQDVRIASPTTDGTVTGVAPGQTVIVMHRGAETAQFGIQVNGTNDRPVAVDRGSRTVAVGDTIALDAVGQNSAAQQGPPSLGALRSLDTSIARVLRNSRVVGVRGGTTRVVNADTATPVFWSITVIPAVTGYQTASIVDSALAARNALHRAWALEPIAGAYPVASLDSLRPGTYGFMPLEQLVVRGRVQIVAQQRDASFVEVMNRPGTGVALFGFASRSEVVAAASRGSLTLRTTPSADAYCPVAIQLSGLEFKPIDTAQGMVYVSGRFRAAVPAELAKLAPLPGCLGGASAAK